MTIRSMTGFAKSFADTSYGKLTVEIQSVNKKYCEIQINLPKVVSFLEEKVRKKIASAVTRGRINVNISLDSVARKNFLSLQPDLQYAEMYLNALQLIQQKFNLPGTIDITMFLGNRDILIADQEEQDESHYCGPLFSLIDECLEKFYLEKEIEGKKLCQDINFHLDIIRNEHSEIGSNAKDSVEKFRIRLSERIQELSIEIPVDQDRIAREVALYADKIDISEELVRLQSHITNFANKLNEGGVVGKTLDFIIQEMFRETNTIASKCNDSIISNSTIRIRTELEKIREQVQNLE